MDKKQSVPAGEQPTIGSTLLGTEAVLSAKGDSSNSLAVYADITSSAAAEAQEGKYDAVISVAGIPIKQVEVVETAQVMVEPGGQSIGILLQTDGVSVVGFSPVVLNDGSTVNPASEAGIETGDFITTINDRKINSNADIAEVIQKAGEAGEICTVKYLRSGMKHSAVIRPLLCCDSNTWRIGLYVRDNTAGIGTMSFYDPQTGVYGALGHEVPDLEYGVKGEIKGSIVRAAVRGITPGESGIPGEKIGVFLDEEWNGSITKNSTFGIFGTLEEAPQTSYANELLSTALPSQVHTGAAQIYTVLDGETIECFDIEIVKCMEGYKLTGKNMVIEVTDPELLEKTGGIVQGMSGSPIIQDGKLVGAVTHVMVNDPTRGYGIFIENMLEAAS